MFVRRIVVCIRLDAGDNFENLSKTQFNACLYMTNEKRSGDGARTCIHIKERAVLFMENFIRGAQHIKEPWFLLLEDDVYVDHGIEIKEGVNEGVDDECVIIGNNHPRIKLYPELIEALRSKGKKVTSTYVGGCGGSLFRTSFWSSLTTQQVEEAIDLFSLKKQIYPSDVLFTFITLLHDKHIIEGQTTYPLEFSEHKPRFGEPMPAILHQFKDWYR
jgi:hypothetical protein